MSPGERVIVFLLLGMLFGGFVGQTIGTTMDRKHAYNQFKHACSTLGGTIADESYRTECDKDGKVVLFRG